MERTGVRHCFRPRRRPPACGTAGRGNMAEDCAVRNGSGPRLCDCIEDGEFMTRASPRLGAQGDRVRGIPETAPQRVHSMATNSSQELPWQVSWLERTAPVISSGSILRNEDAWAKSRDLQ